MAEVKKIAVIAGDGIGPEVVNEAIKVLQRVEELYGYRFEFEHGLFGGIAIDEKGTPLPDETLEMCRSADAVLLGAVGGPKWDNNPKELRPETGLLGIRKELGLFSNLRPAVVFDCLIEASTLKREVLEGTDLAEEYRAGAFEVLSLDTYIRILEECIESIPPEMVVHRLTGDGAKRSLIAPRWSADKKRVLNEINRAFERDRIRQGKRN